MIEKPLVIGIAGASASGKSLVAERIFEDLGESNIVIIPEDSYYHDMNHLPIDERELINYDHPDSFDHSLCAKQLDMLRDGKSIDLPIYNYETHTRSKQTKHINPTKIIIIEGILLFSSTDLMNRMDIKLFVDTPLDICLIRRIKRDTVERGRTLESVLNQYMTTVRPMYLEYIEPSKHKADLVIPKGGKNTVAIDLVLAKLRSMI